jgi:vacuolar-type H+-ATPase subunit I/STV1
LPPCIAILYRVGKQSFGPNSGLTGHFWLVSDRGIFRQDSVTVIALPYIQQMRDDDPTSLDLGVSRAPPGFSAIGLFLFFGAIMASLAATTLLWRDTVLDRLWALNPKAYKQLMPLGGTVGVLFLLLGVALATACIGWFRRRLWGWRLAVVIIATQILGDVINFVRRDLLRGGAGVIIASVLLLFLLGHKSEPRLSRISFEEIQKADNR